MSIETLGRHAGDAVRAATADLDIDAALTLNLQQPRRQRRLGPALVAAAVLVLIVGWAISGDLRPSADSAPPLDRGPGPVLVGEKLGVPMTAAAPTGWEVLKNRAYVDMRPADGSPGMHMYMVVPRKVYAPPSDKLARFTDDPAVWVKTHPGLKTLGKGGLDGPGFAWIGQRVDLSLSPRAKSDWVHLMPLSGAAGSPPLSITADDAMYRWIVIYFKNSPPLVIAATSPTPKDPDLITAINELLASIQIQQQ